MESKADFIFAHYIYFFFSIHHTKELHGKSVLNVQAKTKSRGNKVKGSKLYWEQGKGKQTVLVAF